MQVVMVTWLDEGEVKIAAARVKTQTGAYKLSSYSLQCEQ